MADDAAPPPASDGFFARLWQRWKALQQRLKEHYAEYGSIALVVYLSLFVLTWIGFTIAIRAGVAVDGAAEQTGSIGAAYVATKLTQPLRILATIAVTPFVAMVWHRVRGKKPAALPPKAQEPGE